MTTITYYIPEDPVPVLAYPIAEDEDIFDADDFFFCEFGFDPAISGKVMSISVTETGSHVAVPLFLFP